MKLENLIKFRRFPFFLLLSGSLFGAVDFESRSTVSYGFKLPYSSKLDCEQSLRLSGKEQSFKQTFTELTLSYEIIDDLSVIIPIRYAIFDDKVKNRISLGGIFKIRMKPIKIRFKSRFQSFAKKSNVSSKPDSKKIVMNIQILISKICGSSKVSNLGLNLCPRFKSRIEEKSP